MARVASLNALTTRLRLSTMSGSHPTRYSTGATRRCHCYPSSSPYTTASHPSGRLTSGLASMLFPEFRVQPWAGLLQASGRGDEDGRVFARGHPAPPGGTMDYLGPGGANRGDERFLCPRSPFCACRHVVSYTRHISASYRSRTRPVNARALSSCTDHDTSARAINRRDNG